MRKPGIAKPSDGEDLHGAVDRAPAASGENPEDDRDDRRDRVAPITIDRVTATRLVRLT